MYIVVLLALLLSVFATNFDIDVAPQGILVFHPDTVIASSGDTLTFHYFPKNHSVTQSSFNAPCVPIGGINSGFVPALEVESPLNFVVTINDTEPIWIYCAQTGHCKFGMAMVVNPPFGESLAAYKLSASEVNSTHANNEIAGGVFSFSSASSGTSSTNIFSISSTMLSSSSATSTETSPINTGAVTVTATITAASSATATTISALSMELSNAAKIGVGVGAGVGVGGILTIGIIAYVIWRPYQRRKSQYKETKKLNPIGISESMEPGVAVDTMPSIYYG